MNLQQHSEGCSYPSCECEGPGDEGGCGKAAMSALVVEPYWANPEHVTSLIPCASDKWQRMTLDAKGLDGLVRDLHPGQGARIDYDAHLCSMQRQQEREGFVLAAISTNIYGFCVRDTLNDGLGVMLRANGGKRGGDGSAARAIEWARKWHAEDPSRRAVVKGYIDSDLRAEFDAAIDRAAQVTA